MSARRQTKKQTELLSLAAGAGECLAALYPDAVCALDWGGEAWRLLVMGMLSAQCTDVRVNLVCKDLFTRCPTAQDLADAPIEEIEDAIRSCGLYRTKARNIKASMIRLVNDCGGVLPDTMEELLLFPGVGRKVANLLLGDVYHKGGVVTDTHCIRICGRIGFYPETLKDPRRVETILDGYIPKEEQSAFCHRIVWFGREVCSARAPRCTECPMAGFCRHNRTKSKEKGEPQ